MKLNNTLLACLSGALLLASPLASATTLGSYNELLNSLKQGNKAFALFDIEKCKVTGENTINPGIKSLSVRIKDLYENISINHLGEKMTVIAVSESGLFG